MTTSVIYPSSGRGQNFRTSSGMTGTTFYTGSNISTLLSTKVTRTRFTNAASNTTNPTATFSATPANGSALICVLTRLTDNATSTMPAGWVQLTASGAAGTRRLEMWWKRAGASEPTVVTMTNATALGWNMSIAEYGGWATLQDPAIISAAATVASTTSITNPQTYTSTAVIGLISGTTFTSATLATSSGSNSSLSQFAATTQTNVSEIVGYNNDSDAVTTYTLGTARATTRGIIGWPITGTGNFISGIYGYAGVAQTTATISEGQLGYEFDTTAIPVANTVSSVTYTGQASAIPTWPSVADVELFNINSTAIAKSGSNTNTVWRTPTELSALTKVASRPAGSAWVASTAYQWTSNSNFLTAINQGSTTRILIATSQQRTGSITASEQTVGFDQLNTMFLTIVHERLVTIPTVTATATATSPGRLAAYLRTLPTVSANASPVISRIASLSATIAASADASPLISRIVSLARTITASAEASPVITRVASLARTIAAAAQAVPGIVAAYQPFSVQLPRVVRLPFRAIVALSQQTKARISQRSTLRLPKE